MSVPNMLYAAALRKLFKSAAGPAAPRPARRPAPVSPGSVPTLGKLRSQNAAKRAAPSRPAPSPAPAPAPTPSGGVPTLAALRAQNAAKRQVAPAAPSGGMSMVSGLPETGWRHFSQLPGQTLPATAHYGPAEIAQYEQQRHAGIQAREQAYANRNLGDRYALFGPRQPQLSSR